MGEKKYIYDQASNGMTVRIPADQYIEWKKTQEAISRGERTSNSQEMVEKLTAMFKGNYSDLIKESFLKHYSSACQILSTSGVVSNVEFELIPIMVVFADFAAANCNSNRNEVLRCMLSSLSGIYPIYSNMGKLDRRTELYGKFIRGKQPHGEWFPPAKDFNAGNGFLRCIIGLGDILVNPECAEDYDGAPIQITDIFSVFRFSTEIMPKVATELSEFFEEIADILELFSGSLAAPHSEKVRPELNSQSAYILHSNLQQKSKEQPTFIDKRSENSNRDISSILIFALFILGTAIFLLALGFFLSPT